MNNDKKQRFDKSVSQEAINESLYVLDMLNAFLASSPDLDNFQRSANHDPISGLHSVIRTCREAIATASEHLGETDASSPDHMRGFGDDDNADVLLIRETLVRANQTKGRTDQVSGDQDSHGQEQYPRLTARDHAIVATIRQGYDLADVAQAVNLRKRSVQRIIDKLKADGALPDDLAASA